MLTFLEATRLSWILGLTLHLGNESVMVPTQEETSSNGESSITVHSLEDTEIPGRSVCVVVATLKEEFSIPAELDGMIEPAVKLPKHLDLCGSLLRPCVI